MSFLGFFCRFALACTLPAFVVVASVVFTSYAMRSAQLSMPARPVVDGFFWLVFSLSIFASMKLYPHTPDQFEMIAGGVFAEINRVWKWCMLMAPAVASLLALPHGCEVYAAARAAAIGDMPVIASFSAAAWAFCNQFWWRLLWPGALAIPIAIVLSLRALVRSVKASSQ